jgi:hypothetical protein
VRWFDAMGHAAAQSTSALPQKAYIGPVNQAASSACSATSEQLLYYPPLKTGISWFEHDSRTGDAVPIAPVSSQIPCQQGILQGSLPIWLPGDAKLREKCDDTALYEPIPYTG